jgi:hypothetical protein
MATIQIAKRLEILMTADYAISEPLRNAKSASFSPLVKGNTRDFEQTCVAEPLPDLIA